MRVLDFSRALAAPLCARLLGELGMEVWKIEDPEHPDLAAGWGPFADGGQSLYYAGLNWNKNQKSVRLGSPEGRAVVRGWVRHADVVVHNFRASTCRRLGLDYESLAAVNPRIIMGTFQAFRTNDRPGLDITVQAALGLAQSLPDQPPQRLGVPAIDIVTGLLGTIGILDAISRRRVTGVGESLVFSLDTASLLLLNHVAIGELNGSAVHPHEPHLNPAIVPNGLFQTQDGWIALCAPSDDAFRRLCEALGLKELYQTHAHAADRVAHAPVVTEQIKQGMERWSSTDCVRALKEAGVAAEQVRPVQTIDWAQYCDLIVTDAKGHRVIRADVSHQRTCSRRKCEGDAPDSVNMVP